MEDGADLLEDGLRLFEYLFVGEAQDGDAPVVEEPVAPLITAFSLGVVRPVDLDGQPRFDAEEVGKVGTDRELSTESEAIHLIATEPTPKERLSPGRMVTVPATEYDLPA